MFENIPSFTDEAVHHSISISITALVRRRSGDMAKASALNYPSLFFFFFFEFGKHGSVDSRQSLFLP